MKRLAPNAKNGKDYISLHPHTQTMKKRQAQHAGGDSPEPGRRPRRKRYPALRIRSVARHNREPLFFLSLNVLAAPSDWTHVSFATAQDTDFFYLGIRKARKDAMLPIRCLRRLSRSRAGCVILPAALCRAFPLLTRGTGWIAPIWHEDALVLALPRGPQSSRKSVSTSPALTPWTPTTVIGHSPLRPLVPAGRIRKAAIENYGLQFLLVLNAALEALVRSWDYVTFATAEDANYLYLGIRHSKSQRSERARKPIQMRRGHGGYTIFLPETLCRSFPLLANATDWFRTTVDDERLTLAIPKDASAGAPAAPGSLTWIEHRETPRARYYGYPDHGQGELVFNPSLTRELSTWRYLTIRAAGNETSFVLGLSAAKRPGIKLRNNGNQRYVKLPALLLKKYPFLRKRTRLCFEPEWAGDRLILRHGQKGGQHERTSPIAWAETVTTPAKYFPSTSVPAARIRTSDKRLLVLNSLAAPKGWNHVSFATAEDTDFFYLAIRRARRTSTLPIQRIRRMRNTRTSIVVIPKAFCRAFALLGETTPWIQTIQQGSTITIALPKRSNCTTRSSDTRRVPLTDWQPNDRTLRQCPRFAGIRIRCDKKKPVVVVNALLAPHVRTWEFATFATAEDTHFLHLRLSQAHAPPRPHKRKLQIAKGAKGGFIRLPNGLCTEFPLLTQPTNWLLATKHRDDSLSIAIAKQSARPPTDPGHPQRWTPFGETAASSKK